MRNSIAGLYTRQGFWGCGALRANGSAGIPSPEPQGPDRAAAAAVYFLEEQSDRSSTLWSSRAPEGSRAESLANGHGLAKGHANGHANGLANGHGLNNGLVGGHGALPNGLDPSRAMSPALAVSANVRRRQHGPPAPRTSQQHAPAVTMARASSASASASARTTQASSSREPFR
ncbi:Squalestatin tetraketide synthase [Frankliniella fusca]|uniref:Squalestatin tetraketide synthase n=1 Tax=Frankliniella fusca TaxID=407009 RepID=A0AAE1GYY1_9NEOP|nr:Squalestatin tetraketide synthase [Frankliniella fusca]